MAPAPQSKIRCRQIEAADLGAVADLLARGFPGRSQDYWARGLERLSRRVVPLGCPRYGYLLEVGGKPVGVLLLLFTTTEADGEARTRCNISSWYVAPAFRTHASLFISFALKQKQATYVNISPAPHTWPTVEAQGFTRYCGGLFFALPALSPGLPGVTVRKLTPDGPIADTATMREADLLRAHADYGCLSLVCSAPDGDHPFIFMPYRIRKGRIPLPAMRLVYCRDVSDFVRFAAPLGRFLLRRGRPWVALDANGPVPGLRGIYTEATGRKYFKGLTVPRLGDLAYTELPLFGP